MYTHVTLKTVQAGTLLGSMVFGPLLSLVKKDSRSLKGLMVMVNRAGSIGASVGLVAGKILIF